MPVLPIEPHEFEFLFPTHPFPILEVPLQTYYAFFESFSVKQQVHMLHYLIFPILLIWFQVQDVKTEDKHEKTGDWLLL